jgi:DNA-binding transcriptional LysR family regulator
MTNLRSLDLNLLTVFEAIFETGSIVRAAARVALSQSAVSHALGRLRDACGDDLFVRLGQGITPTKVAQSIYPQVKKSLDGLRQSLSEARGFAPATSERHFHIAIPHPMGPMWAVELSARIEKIAPRVVLSFDTQTLPAELPDQMRAGDVDVAVDYMAADDKRFVQRKLFDERIVFLARRGHPRASPRMELKALKRERYVRIHHRRGRPSKALEAIRKVEAEINLDVALRVSELLEIPFVVMTTDLLGAVPASLARAAEKTGLMRIVEVPAEVPTLPALPTFMTWHEIRRSDKGHRWLRDLVAKIMRDAASP